MFSVQKTITWRKTHSSSTTHKNQDQYFILLGMVFWEVNNLFKATEFTIQDCKSYCKGKDYIKQISQA